MISRVSTRALTRLRCHCSKPSELLKDMAVKSHLLKITSPRISFHILSIHRNSIGPCPDEKITHWKHFARSTTVRAQVANFNFDGMDSAARFSLQCSYFSPKQNHLDVCPLFPVKCPNMCGKMEVPREKVEYIKNTKLKNNMNSYDCSSTYKISWWLLRLSGGTFDSTSTRCL